MGEKELYAPIEAELNKLLKQNLEKCRLFITHKQFPPEVREKFDDITFFFLGKVANPDIAGFAEDKDLGEVFIVVEIKDREPKIDDFYQAKRYAEIFDADYCFLICTKPLSEKLRRAFKSKKWILFYTRNKEVFPGDKRKYDLYRNVHFFEYDKNKGELITDWFPDNPFKKTD